ncbi:Hypothetical protein SMAX5B_000146 [Scophthalmus maximus]|uniref:Ig-like domain-containing protein n=1 Tax=Scophthalmus maximus TaxID=52904 RepID=A0A2U9CUR8_SCOMX|nr:Hypothetical protein SMAX5B_000146 [Scophthalmus maximus]KAF0023916.1 hypothetical protein F2P81_024546 [Scophthalmus maximus]
MVEFKWTELNQISLFLILVLHFRAIKGRDPHLTVIVGDEVTLPCENRTEDQLKCNGTSWLFNERPRSPAVEQIKLGQVVEQARTKSDRLSVTEDCSLVVKKVTVKDAGLYACRQFNKSGQQQGSSALVYLSVINIHVGEDAMTITCSVLTYEHCGHTVEWLNTGVKDEWQSSQVSCSSTVTFKPSLPHPKYEESLRCRVTDRDGGNLLLCSVSTQSPCEKRGSSVDLVDSNERDDGCQKANQKCSSVSSYSPHWWWFIIGAVGLAALCVVALIRWRRTNGNKTQMDDDAVS